jgi:N-acetylglucosaminyl-diphospho-decaprenol L-rhamnosyltransferase
MPKVSVVIVSFNTRELLRRCLEKIPADCERIVVDNASEDGSADMVESEFPEVKLIRCAENRGFGAANNAGADLSQGDLLLYLNSDAYPREGAIERLAAVFDDPCVAAAGGRLVHPDGRLQLSSANELTLWAVLCEQASLEKLFPRSPLFATYWNSHRIEAPTPVAQVMGACLMTRRGLERFDERFFLYCEDTDLCRRLAKHGAILYVPEAEFVHELGASSGRERWRAVALYNRGKELYFEIHRGKAAALACLLLDRLGALCRLVFWGSAALLSLGMARGLRSRAGLWWRVLTAPRKGPRPRPRTSE